MSSLHRDPASSDRMPSTIRYEGITSAIQANTTTKPRNVDSILIDWKNILNFKQINEIVIEYNLKGVYVIHYISILDLFQLVRAVATALDLNRKELNLNIKSQYIVFFIYLDIME